MMDRFNQGFGAVSPMEKCKDGDWVKYEDVAKFIDDLDELLRIAHDDEEYLREAYDENRLKLIVLFFSALAGWLSFGFLVLVEKGII